MTEQLTDRPTTTRPAAPIIRRFSIGASAENRYILRDEPRGTVVATRPLASPPAATLVEPTAVRPARARTLSRHARRPSPVARVHCSDRSRCASLADAVAQ